MSNSTGILVCGNSKFVYVHDDGLGSQTVYICCVLTIGHFSFRLFCLLGDACVLCWWPIGVFVEETHRCCISHVRKNEYTIGMNE